MTKLTIIEKIKNLTWFNLIEQLQDILPNFNKRIEYLEEKGENNNSTGIEEAPVDGNQYARQNAGWSEITGGGGSATLQQVVDNVATAVIGTVPDNFSGLTLLNEDTILLGASKNENSAVNINLGKDSGIIEYDNTPNGVKSAITFENGNLGLSYSNTDLSAYTQLSFAPSLTTTANLIFPNKNGTIATLGDISAQAILNNNLPAVTTNQQFTITNNTNQYSTSLSNREIAVYSPIGKTYIRNNALSFSVGGRCIQLSADNNQSENSQYYVTMPNSNGQLATTQPVSATDSGLVNNVSLQELGGVDKNIHGVRIGKGEGTNTVNNLVVGSNESLAKNTTGGGNTGIGIGTLLENTTSVNNTAIGAFSLASNSTATSNTAVGVNSLNGLLSGVGFNNAFGSSSLRACTTGNQNAAFGSNSLRNCTTGTFNMAVGNSALMTLVTGIGNTAVGAAAGNGITGNYNTSLGYLANGFNTSSTGDKNITIGYQAGRDLSTGAGNVLIQAPTGGGSITTGSNNVIINQAGIVPGITTGSGNTIIGAPTGLGVSDSNLVVIANGVGAIAIKKEADNRLLAPTLTNALISSGGAQSLITKTYLESNFLALLETTRSKGVANVVLDGSTSVYNISHGLGQVPSVAFANIIDSVNFENFKVTWDATNIILTYPSPPAAETIKLSWIALK